MARSSVVEIDNCLTACVALKYFTKLDIKELDERNIELFKLISGLIDSNNK